MTSRRPPGVPVQTWVDRQLGEARARGAFDDLPGAGRPLDADRLEQGAEEWALAWARREGADLTLALPPALALRVARERLVAAVPGMDGEAAVRRAVEDFNAELDAAYRRPQLVPPPVALAFLDAERQVARWRDARPAPVDAPADASPAPPPGAPAAGGRRGWRWRWRRAPRGAPPPS